MSGGPTDTGGRMQLAEVFERVIGAGTPVEFQAYDGSRSGPVGCDVRVTIKSPRAVSSLVLSPGELGLARVYVAGDLDVDGDLHTALRRLSERAGNLSWRERLEVMRSLGIQALRPHAPPGIEVRMLPGGAYGRNAWIPSERITSSRSRQLRLPARSDSRRSAVCRSPSTSRSPAT